MAMQGKWFDLCSLEKSEKSVVDQISQFSSVVVKNPKNSYDIFINAYSYCNSHVERAKRVKDGQAEWRKQSQSRRSNKDRQSASASVEHHWGSWYQAQI